MTEILFGASGLPGMAMVDIIEDLLKFTNQSYATLALVLLDYSVDVML